MEDYFATIKRYRIRIGGNGMKEILKRIKADVVLSALLCIITGVVVMVWPAAITILLGRMIGLVLLIMGLAHALSYLANREENRIGLASGVVVFALGVLIFVRPELVAQMVSVVVGVILIMHGVGDLQLGLESRRNGDDIWWLCILLSAATILFGVFVIWKYFQVAKVATWLVGLALVFDGLGDLFVVYRVTKAAKRVLEEEDAIDVEYKE